MVITVCTGPYPLISQTAPGGVLTSSACRLWLDAGDLNADGNYTNNPVVDTRLATWNDKSGNANHLVQALTGARPTYTTRAGYSSVYFDNTGSNANYMDATAQSMLSPGTMYFVLHMVNAGDGANCLFDQSNTGNTSLRFAQWNGTGQLGFTKYGTADYASSIASTYTTNLIVSYLKTAASDNVLIAQNNASVNLTVSSSNPGLPLYTLGKNNTNDGMSGYVMEILAYNTELNPAQRIIIDNYLSAKYGGIPILSDRYVGDTSGNGDYDFELGGVGTESAGSNTAVASSVTGGLGVTQATAMGNGEYLLFAHQEGRNGLEFVDVGGMSTGPARARWKRIWYFDWTHVGGTNETVNLTFDYSDAGSAGGTAGGALSNYKLLYRSGLTGSWTEVMNASSISGDRVTFNGLAWNTQGDGYYTIGSLNTALSPLPVELLSFEAEACDREVCIDWSCATEKNTDHFLLERSKDGHYWTEVQTLAAAGDSHMKTEYSATDPKPFNGTSYYRLMIVDKDRSFRYSPLSSVALTLGRNSLSVAPNPSAGAFTLISDDIRFHPADIELYDQTGRKIQAEMWVLGRNSVLLDISGYPAGIYFVKVQPSGGQRMIAKIIKH